MKVWYFLRWCAVDMLRVFEDWNLPKTFMLIFGGECGTLLSSYTMGKTETVETMMYVIPITLVVATIVMMIDIQWKRFIAEQERIAKSLTDNL